MNFRAGRGEFNLVRAKNTIWLLETAVKLASYKEIGDRGMRVAERNVTDLISCDRRPSGKQKSLQLESCVDRFTCHRIVSKVNYIYNEFITTTYNFLTNFPCKIIHHCFFSLFSHPCPLFFYYYRNIEK